MTVSLILIGTVLLACTIASIIARRKFVQKNSLVSNQKKPESKLVAWCFAFLHMTLILVSLIVIILGLVPRTSAARFFLQLSDRKQIGFFILSALCLVLVFFSSRALLGKKPERYFSAYPELLEKHGKSFANVMYLVFFMLAPAGLAIYLVILALQF